MKVVMWNSRGRIVGDTIRETSILHSFGKKTDVIGSSIIKDCYVGNPLAGKLIVDKRLDILTTDISIFEKIYAYIGCIFSALRKIKQYDLCIITQKNKYLFAFLSNLVGTPTILKEDLPSNKTKFYFSKAELKASDKYIKKTNKKKIGINIESRSIDRAWSIKKYIELIGELIELDFEIYLLGYDINYNSEVVSHFGNEIINLVKMKLSVRKSATILSKMDWYIGNDSGFAHVSVASGTNTTVIFQNSTSELLNRGDVIVKKLRNPSVNNVVNIIK